MVASPRPPTLVHIQTVKTVSTPFHSLKGHTSISNLSAWISRNIAHVDMTTLISEMAILRNLLSWKNSAAMSYLIQFNRPRTMFGWGKFLAYCYRNSWKCIQIANWNSFHVQVQIRQFSKWTRIHGWILHWSFIWRSSQLIQSGAAYRSRGFEDEDLGSSPACLGSR